MTPLWEQQTRLASYLKGPHHLDLSHGALLIAALEYPHLNIDQYLKKIKKMAEDIAPHLSDSFEMRDKIEILNEFLFHQWKFRGNKKDYYNPKNSFLNDVIDYKTGIPITLSVVYLSIAHQLNMPLKGVNFPGHFLVGALNEQENFYINTFNEGKILSLEDCADFFDQQFGEEAKFQSSHLDPASNKQILFRILNNLKSIYLLKKDFVKALTMITHLLLCTENVIPELKQRGLLALSLECYQLALQDFEKVSQLSPDDEDAPFIQEQIKWLKDKVGHIV